MGKTPKQYEQEIEELRVRLQEAEETLEAIRTGAVDAIVVSQGQQEQVFTLQGAESAYRIILERLSEGAATLADDGTIVYCNARFAEILAKPLDQMIGTRIEQYVLPADLASFAGMLRRTVQEDFRGEVQFQDSDGTAIPMYLSLAPLADSPTASVCMVATDLRERKRTEEILASEQFIRRLFDSTPIGVAVVGRDLRYILANPAHQAITGDPDAPLAGRSIAEVFPPAVAQIVGPFVQRVLDRGEPLEVQDYEAPLRGRTWWNVSGIPLRSAHGDAEAVLVLTQEVTERKLAEDALRESESKFRSLFENSLDAVFLTIPDGGIRAANPAACAMFGMSEEEICRVGREGLTDPDDPRHATAMEERKRTHRISNAELCYVRKNGEKFVAEVNSVVLPGDPPRSFVTLRDITDRKLAEEQLMEWSRTLEQRVAERTAEVEQRVAQLRAMTTELTLAEHRERQRIAKVLHDHLQQLLVGARFHVSSAQSQIVDPQVRQLLDQVNTLLDDSVQSSRSLTAELFPPALREGTFAEALRWLIQWMRDNPDFPQEGRVRKIVVPDILQQVDMRYVLIGTACQVPERVRRSRLHSAWFGADPYACARRRGIALPGRCLPRGCNAYQADPSLRSRTLH